MVRIEGGLITGKYNVSDLPNGDISKAKASTNFQTMAITCNDVCIPVYQTICAGPIEGLEGEASGSCETTQIGQRCVQICYVTGNPNVPLPGGGGGGSTTPGWGNPADPCDQVDNLKNNTEFKAKMTDLKNKTALTYEAAYTFTTGTSTYNYHQGEIDDEFIELSVSNPIDGYVHSHTKTGFTTFSAADVQAIYQLYSANKLNSLNTFTAGVVVPSGSSYILKVSNSQAFLEFSAANFNTTHNFNTLETVYNGATNVFLTMGRSLSEARQAAFLTVFKDAGLRLFKGDHTFNNWQGIGLNGLEVINTNCN